MLKDDRKLLITLRLRKSVIKKLRKIDNYNSYVDNLLDKNIKEKK